MNWLLRSILRDDVHLNPAQMKLVSRRARELATKDRWTWFLTVLPGMLPIVAIGFWRPLRARFPIGWYITFEIVFTLSVLAMVVFIIRRQYSKHAWRAVRELGLADVCGNCGYNLAGRPDGQRNCSECGGLITPLGSANASAVNPGAPI